MAEKIAAPKGTSDILPSDSGKWQALEALLRETAGLFGFSELRFPTFEHTELFTRGVGGTTDIVQKEMYTFIDKGNRSISLRPEGTASVVRALIEHNLDKQGLPVKVYYIAPNFRYEKPQAGRLREHHQFGVECFGPESPAADAEIIALADTFLHKLGITGVTLLLNSIGCKECRPVYNKALRAYFEQHLNALCPTCKERFERNPLRILDCKNPECGQIVRDAPAPAEHLCQSCTEHHNELRRQLDALNIKYTNAPKLVRGLDYYTRTVFEFVSDALGAQSTVCAGGRYNHLVEELGGQSLPGLGFGSGLERLLMILEAKGIKLTADTPPALYLCATGDNAVKKAQLLALELRRLGISVEIDLLGRSVKAQMKQADKLKARYTLVLGDDELLDGEGMLKNMNSGETTAVILTANNIMRGVTAWTGNK